MPPAPEPYNPETSLADSLGELSDSMKDMPDTFMDMSTNLDKADNNLEMVKDSMTLMSENVSYNLYQSVPISNYDQPIENINRQS